MKEDFKIRPIALRLALLLLFFHCAFAATAQNQYDIFVEHFSRSDGLKHRHVNDLVKGPSGRIWISTQQGINYFDGLEFIDLSFMLSRIEVDNFFWCYFSKDAEGNIWAIPGSGDFRNPILLEHNTGFLPKEMITSGFILPVYDEVYHFEYTTFEGSEQGKKAFSLLADSLGLSGPSRKEKKLWQLIDQFFEVKRSTMGHEYRIVTQLPDQSYVVWARHNGYLWIDADFSEFSLIPYDSNKNNETFFWQGLPIDSRHNLKIPTKIENGLIKFEWVELPLLDRTDILNIAADQEGSLLILFYNHQLMRVQRESGEVEQFSFGMNRIKTLLKGDKNLYLAGTENGLHRVTIKDGLFKNIGSLNFSLDSPSPIGLSVSDICMLDDEVYFHRYFGDLYSLVDFDSALDTIRFNKTESDFRIYSILPIQSNTKNVLALGTTRGLFLYHPTENNLFRVPSSLSTVQRMFFIEKHNQVLLDLRNNQYQYFDPETLAVTDAVEYPADLSYVLLTDADHIYMNGKGSLVRFNSISSEYETLFELNSRRDISGADIRAIHKTDSLYWMGTFEGFYGICSQTFKVRYHYNSENGLPGEIVYSLVPFKNGFWLGTDNGLTYIEPGSGKIKSFFEWDGLSHNEFNTASSMIDGDGNIWMGGLNGINVFDPIVVSGVEFAAKRLFVEQISVYDAHNQLTYKSNPGRDILEETLYLKPGANSLYLRMAHFAMVLGEKTAYRWYLHGLEEPWINVSNNPSIAYRNLPAGKYELRIAATGFRGISAANEVVILFEIANYWYYSTQAVVIWISIGIFALVFGTRYIYLRKMERQKIVQLQELDRQKTDLYTNITHEFRTPLTAILGQAERGEELSSVGKELRHIFNTIGRNGTQLLELVNQMMDLARVEAGGTRIKEDKVQLSDFLKHIAYSFEPMAEEKNVTLRAEISHRLEENFSIDTQKLSCIVGNLVSNAIKFSPRNGEVSIRCEHIVSLNRDDQILFLEVSDEGPGIPLSEREKVFDRFYRINSDLTDTTPGTGIGLALSRELVNLLNGEIGLKSGDSGGSVFYVKLPLKLCEDGSETLVFSEKNQRYSRSSKNELASLETYAVKEDAPTILLVEDNKDVLDYIRACIPDKWRILTAENGHLGLEAAIREIPDLIISDVMMPEKDGFTLCDELKSHRATDHIPVILLTARADMASRLQGLKKGADAYLSKPFNKQELLLVIDNMFRHSQKIRSKFGEFIADKEESIIRDTEIPSEDLFINELYRTIQDNYADDGFSIDLMASALHFSRSQLYRKVKALTGKSPSELLRNYRMETARKIIEEHPYLGSAELAAKVGFASPKHFSNVFFEEFGFRPIDLKKQD